MEPWERIPRETKEAYNAFRCYCELGKERSLERVSAETGKSLKVVRGWASKHDWEIRLEDYKVHESQEVMNERLEELTEMLERQVKIGMKLQADVTASIRERGLGKASFHSLAEMLKIGMEMERTARQALVERKKEEGNNDVVITILPAKEKII